MKLGESGEAFFVEECPEDCLEILPDHMATSPIPSGEFQQYVESANSSGASDNLGANAEEILPLPRPRRNSIDLSTQTEVSEAKDIVKFENQISNYTSRRWVLFFVPFFNKKI